MPTASCRVAASFGLALALCLAASVASPQEEPRVLPETSGAFYAISVQDIDRAVAWYTRYLGFATTSRGGNDQRKGALLARPGALLELGEFNSAVAREDLRPGLESHDVYGLFKLGFTTASLDEAYEFLQREGVEVFFSIVTASDGNRTFGVKDPEGNIIQFFGR